MSTDGLRRRQKDQPRPASQKPISLGGAVSRFDIFRKTKHQFVERSTGGGVFSCVIIFLLFVLFLNEWRTYYPLRRLDTMTVDEKVQDSIEIYFNITFPNVKCNKLHVDVVDAAGDAQIDIGFNVVKNAVTKTGRIISMGRNDEKNKYRVKPYKEIDDPLSPSFCGKCFLRKYNKGQCCNTCQNVINRLRELKVTVPQKTEIPQCINEISTMYEGCNMYGVLIVNKVTGNFHFAPGHSYSSETGRRVAHIHEYDPTVKFDCSHIIHEMRFGRKADLINNPLDSSQVLVNGTTIHKYFIKVVPTSVKFPFWLYDYEAYQYSFTEHSHKYTTEAIQMPGIFLIYDFSAIRVNYQHYRPPILQFIIGLAGVIGGLWAVFQFVNSFGRETVDTFLRKKHD